MTYRNYIKKVPGFTFMGPMLMLAGMLTAADIGLIYGLNPEMVLDGESMNFALAYFLCTAFFSFLLMHAGYLLYSGMVYSRYYACIVLYLCLAAVLGRVFLFGLGPSPWKLFIEAAFIAFCLIYISQKKFRIRFQYKRSAMTATIFFFWVFALMAGTYVYLRSSEGADKAPPVNSISFDESVYDDSMAPIPMAYGIKVPDNFHLSSLEDESGDLTVTFHNPSYGYLIINNFSSITPIYKRMRVLGYDNEYDFALRFYKEKVGLVPIFLRKTMAGTGVTEYDVVSIGHITLLIEKAAGDNTIAHVFHGNDLIGEVSLISISSNDTGLYNEIFSTIRYREPEHDAQKLYDMADALMKKKEPEQAKRLLASASVIRPDYAEYRYLLAETFALTGYVSSAKKELREYMKLSGDREKAAKLLDTLNKLN